MYGFKKIIVCTQTVTNTKRPHKRSEVFVAVNCAIVSLRYLLNLADILLKVTEHV